MISTGDISSSSTSAENKSASSAQASQSGEMKMLPSAAERERELQHLLKELEHAKEPSRLPECQDKLFVLSAQCGRDQQDSGETGKALEHYKRALQVKHNRITSESPPVQRIFAEILFDVGVIHMKSSFPDRTKILQALHLCLDVRRMCFGSRHPAVASVLFKLAMIYHSMGDLSTTSDLLLEALAIFHWCEPENPAQAKIWTALGAVQQALGQFDDAKSSIAEAACFVPIDDERRKPRRLSVNDAPAVATFTDPKSKENDEDLRQKKRTLSEDVAEKVDDKSKKQKLDSDEPSQEAHSSNTRKQIMGVPSRDNSAGSMTSRRSTRNEQRPGLG